MNYYKSKEKTMLEIKEKDIDLILDYSLSVMKDFETLLTIKGGLFHIVETARGLDVFTIDVIKLMNDSDHYLQERVKALTCNNNQKFIDSQIEVLLNRICVGSEGVYFDIPSVYLGTKFNDTHYIGENGEKVHSTGIVELWHKNHVEIKVWNDFKDRVFTIPKLEVMHYEVLPCVYALVRYFKLLVEAKRKIQLKKTSSPSKGNREPLTLEKVFINGKTIHDLDNLLNRYKDGYYLTEGKFTKGFTLFKALIFLLDKKQWINYKPIREVNVLLSNYYGITAGDSELGRRYKGNGIYDKNLEEVEELFS